MPRIASVLLRLLRAAGRPKKDVRIHEEYWRVSGRVADIENLEMKTAKHEQRALEGSGVRLGIRWPSKRRRAADRDRRNRGGREPPRH
jgi:hypothetical protein